MRFIENKQELEKFKSANYFVERNICKKDLLSEAPATVESNLESDFKTRMSYTITQEIKSSIENNEDGKIQCIFIEVDKDDGMTWAAERAHDVICQTYDQFKDKIIPIKGYGHDGPPMVTALIGENSFYKILRKRLSLKTPRRKTYLKILLPIIVLNVLVQLIINLRTNPSISISAIFLNPINFLLITAAIVSALFLNILPVEINSNSDKEKYLKMFEEESENNTDKYESILNDIIECIATSDPRIVIIDNYNELDQPTRVALEGYFLRYTPRNVFEIWLAFYAEKGPGSLALFSARNNNSWIVNNRIATYCLRNLNYEQKKKIVKNLNLPSAALNFSVIKAICGFSSRDNSSAKKFLREYRKEHPVSNDTYDDLEVMFLLSLNASPGKLFLNIDEYEDILKSQRFILEKFMHGKKADSRSIKEIVSRILITFSQFIKAETFKNVKRYAITSEFKETLIKDEFYKALGLPNPKIGHLFWTLHWGKKLKTVKEAGWYNKLSHHILNSGDISSFDAESRDKIRVSLYNTIIPETINGCLASGLFDDIPELLSYLSALLEDINSDQSEIVTQQIEMARFINKCWKCYVLTENKSILNLIKSANYQPSNEADLAIKTGRFFDIIPANYTELLMPVILKNDATSSVEVNQIDRFIYIQSILVSLVFTDLVRSAEYFGHNNSEYIYIADCSDPYLQLIAVIEGTMADKSLTNPAEEIEITTLSNSIWSLALTIEYYGNTVAAKNYEEEQSEMKNKFEALLEIIQKISQHFSHIIQRREEKGNLPQETQYFKHAYIFDFYANALLAIVMSYSVCLEKDAAKDISNDCVETINAIIKEINNNLSFKIPGINNLRELIYVKGFAEELEKLFRLCMITERCIGVENLFASLTFKSIMFNIKVRKLSNDKIIEVSSIVRSRKSLYGIISNLLISSVQNESAELRSIFLYSSLEITVSEGFGEHLAYELLLLVISKLAFNSSSMTDAFRIFSKAIDNLRFRSTLESINDNYLTSFILNLYSFLRLAKDDDLREKTMSVLMGRVEKTLDVAVKEEVMVLIDSRAIVEMLRRKEQIILEDVLQKWKGNTYYLYYAELLSLLVENDYYSDELKDEAKNLIDINFFNYSANTFLFLSTAMLEKATPNKAKTEEISLFLDYTKEAIVRWENRLSTRYNVVVFDLLLELDHENKREYQEKVKKWRLVNLHISDIELMYMINNRQFFDYFKFCYENLRIFGMDSDIANDDIQKQFRMSGQEANEKVLAWISLEAKTPNPFIDENEKILFSSKFLLIGHYLFDLQAFDDQQYQKYRNSFNRAAGENMNQLFSLIATLSGLPISFKDVIKKHSNRFETNLNVVD